MEVAGHVALRFTDGAGAGAPVNLTAVCAQGAHLWVAGDETAALGRLVLDSTTSPTRAGRQRVFRLADLVQLPGPATGEADIKGIACTDGWLWAVGSHALVRRRPKPEHDDQKVVRRLGKLRRDPNRFVIARLAVQLGVDRRPEPVRVSRDGRRSALIGAPGAESLVDLLRADAHLAPFLAIPGQDNGFEVQGLAAVGDRLYVGLRGPVLRGWAVVLEVRPAQDPTDPGRLALGIFPEGARYRKHVLDLGGLGVRGLSRDGDDLLVLAGPAMAVPGPVRVHRWTGAAAAATGPVVRDADLPVEAVVPHGEDDDRPAGMALLPHNPHDPRARLLVVYDGPAAARLPWPGTVLADRVRIGPHAARVDEHPVDEHRVDEHRVDEHRVDGPGAAGGPLDDDDDPAVDQGPTDAPHPTDATEPLDDTVDEAADPAEDDSVDTAVDSDAGTAPEVDHAGTGTDDAGPRRASAGDAAHLGADDVTSSGDEGSPPESPARDDPAPGDAAPDGATGEGPLHDGTPDDGAPHDGSEVPTRRPDRVRPAGHLAADLLHLPAAIRTWSGPDG